MEAANAPVPNSDKCTPVDMTAAVRTSPAYEFHTSSGAVFREKNGWRRVDYFATNESPEFEQLRPAGPARQNWSTAVVAEHRATRKTAGLFDLTSFGKIEVAGPGAGPLLEWLCSNVVTRGVGQLTYTQMLNVSGGVVGDVTVGQLSNDSFLMITGTSALPHDLGWLRARLSCPEAGVTEPAVVQDVTSAWACFALWGPSSRDILQPLVGTSLDSADFPYMRIHTSEVSGVPIRLARVTFVGELGWEIYIPSEYGRWLWELLSSELGRHGGLKCGYRTIDSLRVEKGYLYLGADLTSQRTPFESGVGNFVRTEKNFLGRSALNQAERPAESLTCFTLTDSWYQLQGGETVRLPTGEGAPVTSGGLGYTIEAAVGFAFLPATLSPDSQLIVEAGDLTLPARITRQPLYDPKGIRIRI